MLDMAENGGWSGATRATLGRISRDWSWAVMDERKRREDEEGDRRVTVELE